MAPFIWDVTNSMNESHLSWESEGQETCIKRNVGTIETCPCRKTFTIPEDLYFNYLSYAGISYKKIKHLGSLPFRYRQVSLYFSQKPATVPCPRILFMYCSETCMKRSLGITEICLYRNIFRSKIKVPVSQGTFFKRKTFRYHVVPL